MKVARDDGRVIGLRQLSSDDWCQWRDLRLAALGEAPYAYSSTLADWQGDGDTAARWRDRLSTVPFNAIADLDSDPAGMVSATWPNEDGEVALTSLWVAPFARGRGVGDALVVAVTQWARRQAATSLALEVVATNDAAIRLYLRHDFRPSEMIGTRMTPGCDLRLTKAIAPRS